MERGSKLLRTAPQFDEAGGIPRRYGLWSVICELRVSFARGTLECEIFGHKPAQAEQQDQGDDCLRYGAIKAPDAQAILLDHGKAEREEKPQTRGKECCETLAREAEATEQQIPGDA